MAQVVASDNDGVLSSWLDSPFTNTLFTRNGTTAYIGDVGTVTIKTDTAGYISPDFTLRCSSDLSLSLDGVTYSGSSLSLGTINSTGITVYVKAMTPVNAAVYLILDQTGVVADDGSVSVIPTVLDATFAVLDPTIAIVAGDITVNADIVDAVFATLDPEIAAGCTIELAEALAATLSILDPTIVIGDEINVNADLLDAAFAILAPDVSGASDVTPDVLNATLAVLDPTISTAASLTWTTYYTQDTVWAAGEPYQLLTTNTNPATSNVSTPGEGSLGTYTFKAKLVKATGTTTYTDVTTWFNIGTRNAVGSGNQTSAEVDFNATTANAGEYLGVVLAVNNTTNNLVFSLAEGVDLTAGKIKVTAYTDVSWDEYETGNYFGNIMNVTSNATVQIGQ